MIVRSISLSDCPSVSELLSDVLTEEDYEETIEEMSKQLSMDSKLILVADHEQQIVGVIIGTIENNQGSYHRVAVHPNYQRKGIRTMLIRSLQQCFERRKVDWIMMDHQDLKIANG